jgi:hypothetical protein
LDNVNQRFVQCALPLPMSAFQVPRGKIAITFDGSRLDPCTAVLPVRDLDQVLFDLEREMGLSENDRYDLKCHLPMDPYTVSEEATTMH